VRNHGSGKVVERTRIVHSTIAKVANEKVPLVPRPAQHKSNGHQDEKKFSSSCAGINGIIIR
jgi:hypothetical protein